MNKPVQRLLIRSAQANHMSAEAMLHERSDQALYLRLGKVGLYKATGHVLASRLGNHFGGNLIASGGEQIVLKNRKDDLVTKILIDSIGSGQARAEALATNLQDMSDRCREVLGDAWTETTFYPASLPRRLGRRAVVAFQPYLSEWSPLDVDIPVPSKDGAASHAQLADLSQKLMQLHESWGIMPDLIGPGNLMTKINIFGDRQIQFVDTIPKTKDELAEFPHDGRGNRLAAQLGILRNWASLGADSLIEWNESEAVTLR